jgi:hypothetical protein
MKLGLSKSQLLYALFLIPPAAPQGTAVFIPDGENLTTSKVIKGRRFKLAIFNKTLDNHFIANPRHIP